MLAKINFATNKGPLPFLFFGLVFIFYTYPMGLSDYWWHMSSGRWIWENLSIPAIDYFTYTYPQDDELRRVVILKAYYLGQLSFYFIYSLAGIWGLLIYKAVLLTVPLWLLWRYLCYKKVDPSVGLVLIAILPFLFYRFDELRAVVFSFIGVISVLFLIEKFIDKLRSGEAAGIYYFLLPATMLLWANLHRGFLIGWVLLVGYLFFETICLIRRRNALEIPAYKKLLVVLFGSVFITLLNPNGLGPLVANFSELNGPFVKVVDEFFPLWKYAGLYGAEFLFYGCLAVSVLAGYFMLRSWRTINPVYPVLMSGFIYQGFMTFRFSYFLAMMALALAAPAYSKASFQLRSKFPQLVSVMLLVVLMVLGYFGYHRTALIYGPWEKAYMPFGAVQYVQDKRPPGNIFNVFEYGGYLGWELYPDYKIFIDQRNLDYSVYEEYGQARNGNYQEIFNKYKIRTVVSYIAQPVLNKVPPIVEKLLYDKTWQVAYIDNVSIVFIQANAAAGFEVLNKKRVIDYINKLLTQ